MTIRKKIPTICGTILAGGKGTRMNSLEKPLLKLASKPMIDFVIRIARPQVNQLVISANRNFDDYAQFDLPLVPDLDSSFSGPLCGIYSSMTWYKNHGINADYLACFPADVPFFPANVVEVLVSAMTENYNPDSPLSDESVVAWCQSADQVQPLFSIWPFSALSKLKQAVQDGIPGPRMYFDRYPNLKVLISSRHPLMFKNVNTPKDLEIVETLIADGNGCLTENVENIGKQTKEDIL